MPDAMTPSQRILARAAEQHELTDELGRRIVVANLSAWDQFCLNRLIGALGSEVPFCAATATAVCRVRSVDGRPVMMPQNEAQLKAAFDLLESEGINAVLTHQRLQMEAATARAMAAISGDVEAEESTDPLARSAK